jgi:PPP family 3-phenylpropionic acid transporter
MVAASRAAFYRFVVLYAALYAAFGVKSPYLPALLADRHLRPEEIGMVLAAGTAVRLAAGPIAGRVADRVRAPQWVLAGSAATAALLVPGYLAASGLPALLVVGVLYMAALAPLVALSDALALGAAAPAQESVADAGRLHYGWLRGAGSAAFILGSILSGQAIGQFGIAVVVWLNAALLAAAALSATRVERLVPSRPAPPSGEKRAAPGDFRALLHLPMFVRMIVVAALILGSHAFHDSFAVIRWGAGGIGPGTAGLLWSESVAAEVVMFFFLGRPLLDRLGVARAAALAASAAVLRWAVMGATAALPAMILMQPLHGITFALLHLACMRLMAETVPPRLAASALALYSTLGIGAATALLTLASGPLYASFGGHGFWAMGALSAAALPIALTLREPAALLPRPHAVSK